jgi:hypothetical protein
VFILLRKEGGSVFMRLDIGACKKTGVLPKGGCGEGRQVAPNRIKDNVILNVLPVIRRGGGEVRGEL